MRRDEGGFALLEWILTLTILLLPAMGLAGAALKWSPRVSAAQLAAYEAARTTVAELDSAAGEQRGREVWENHGFPAEDFAVSFSGELGARGGTVTATVTVQLPLVRLPAGSVGDRSWSRSHTERVPDYASLP